MESQVMSKVMRELKSLGKGFTAGEKYVANFLSHVCKYIPHVSQICLKLLSSTVIISSASSRRSQWERRMVHVYTNS